LGKKFRKSCALGDEILSDVEWEKPRNEIGERPVMKEVKFGRFNCIGCNKGTDLWHEVGRFKGVERLRWVICV
jgi:hypothetical protein